MQRSIRLARADLDIHRDHTTIPSNPAGALEDNFGDYIKNQSLLGSSHFGFIFFEL
ncbi:MAG: hypothetical protein RI564_04865 [Gracilimonas sp.]|nr:hypothetical protein [Gracilimonas sp.]